MEVTKMKREYKAPTMVDVEMSFEEHIVASGSQITCSRTFFNDRSELAGCTVGPWMNDGTSGI